MDVARVGEQGGSEIGPDLRQTTGKKKLSFIRGGEGGFRFCATPAVPGRREDDDFDEGHIAVWGNA